MLSKVKKFAPEKHPKPKQFDVKHILNRRP